MLLHDSDVRFSRDEVSRILNRSAAESLLESDVVSATALEAFCSNALLRLYQAAAERHVEFSIELPEAGGLQPHAQPKLQLQPPPQAEPASTPDEAMLALADYQAEPERRKSELRLAPRYVPRRQLNGMIRDVKFAILQMSTTGLRIRHDDTLRPGDEARLTFALLKPARSFFIRAQVVWTSIAQRGDAPSFCISGLRVTAGEEQIEEAIRVLLAQRELTHEEERAASTAPRGAAALSGVSDDDVASIIRAVRRFSSDPVEASRWYTRARFAITDDAVRKAAPERARDREEVLGIWEYLQRRVEIPAITGVVTWIRQTRSAGAV